MVEGRSESARRAGAVRAGDPRASRCRGRSKSSIRRTATSILFPDKRTTFGVVEMTTGCGRRCQFCVPDLNPQIDFPKDKIMEAVRANVRDGNKQISLATEDMFIWGQVHTRHAVLLPEPRSAASTCTRTSSNTPGVEQHVLSHATMAPAVVDPVLIEQLSERAARQEPDPAAVLSTHPRRQGARAAHRAGDRLGADGEADHAEQGRAVPDRGMAERRHPAVSRS